MHKLPHKARTKDKLYKKRTCEILVGFDITKWIVYKRDCVRPNTTIEKKDNSISFICVYVCQRNCTWNSSKQAAISTTENKFNFILSLAHMMYSWGVSFIGWAMDFISRPLRYCDNLAVHFLSKNNKSDSQSKHIHRVFAIGECAKREQNGQ